MPDLENFRNLMRTLFEYYADQKGWKLSDNADKVIENIILKNGNCPCRFDKVQCLTCGVEDDVEEKGRCHCNLFIR